MQSFKAELDLKNEQRTLCARHAGTSRHAYNWGLALCKQLLQHNKENPTNKIKFPTAIDLHKLLVASVKVANPPASKAGGRLRLAIAAGGTMNRPSVRHKKLCGT